VIGRIAAAAPALYHRRMRMGHFALAGAALAGCGQVKDPPGSDGRTCAGDTIAACGAACVACPGSSGRTAPTCDGAACGTACKNTALKCSDNTCVQTQWTFEAGSVDGITPRLPDGLALAVRNFNGAQALAVDITNLFEVSFRIPVCLSGVVDVRPRTFSMRVFFQGGTTGGIQYYVQASVPSPQQPGAILGQTGVAAQLWTPYVAPLGSSQFSGTCSEITIQAGSYGDQFSGTVWFDDIKLE
jgi:hypothetical protein